jgi:hypothetical protein
VNRSASLPSFAEPLPVAVNGSPARLGSPQNGAARIDAGNSGGPILSAQPAGAGSDESSTGPALTEDRLTVLKASETFSTEDRPQFRVIKNEPFSTKKSPQVPLQQELINSDLKSWKRLKGKPPIPEKHVLNPSGKRQIGRRIRTGYEILRRVPCCDCGKESRLVAGYISATQILGLEREGYEIKVGIIKNILRKKAGGIDRRLLDLRCPRCESRRQGSSVQVVEAL